MMSASKEELIQCAKLAEQVKFDVGGKKLIGHAVPSSL